MSFSNPPPVRNSFVRGEKPSAAFHPLPQPDPVVNNSLRKVGFWCALCVIFLRYSLLHEALMVLGGSNAKILYIFALPAALCLIFSGGLQRIFSARSARFWGVFAVWIFFCVPFSFWKGDSAAYALTYVRTDLPMLAFLGGLAVTWKECRIILYTIALAGLTSVCFSRIFSHDYGGRMGLSFGTMANPNDYACILILGLPFMAYMVIRPMGGIFPLRKLSQLAGILGMLYAAYLIIASGSRGAMIAVLACAIFLFFKGGTVVRICLLAVIPVGGLALVTVLPASVIARLSSFSTDVDSRPEDQIEAAESAAIRKGLLQASLYDTITHPLFGVGPGQFPNFEGQSKTHSEGGYITTHNSYTAISSEMGFPGLVLYLAGTISAFMSLHGTWRTASKAANKELATACLLVLVSNVGYCVAITFLNFGYFFYLPAFAGLSIALGTAVKRETEPLLATGPASTTPLAMVVQSRRQVPRPGPHSPQPALAPNPALLANPRRSFVVPPAGAKRRI